MSKKNKQKKEDYTLAWTNPNPGEIKPQYAIHSAKRKTPKSTPIRLRMEHQTVFPVKDDTL